MTLGYDHLNFVSSSGEFAYLNRSSELPLVRAGFNFRPDLTVGTEEGASFTTYDQQVLNNYENYSAGLYADWRLGSFIRVQPRAGYELYQFQRTSESAQIFDLTPSGTPVIVPVGESIQTQNLNAWYADLTVTHQVSEAIRYGLSAGHEIIGGIQADVIEDYYLRPNVNWKIIKGLDMSTSLFYEHGNQGTGNISGNLTETFDWYGGSIVLGHPLTKKLALNLNYRLTLRSSDIPSRDYSQNLVGLRFTYKLQ